MTESVAGIAMVFLFALCLIAFIWSACLEERDRDDWF